MSSARVDSLCIVQDDEDDWITEAKKMSSIYRNATITLSADGAENSAGGLFGPVSARAAAHQAYPIQTIGADGDPVTLYARKRYKYPSDPNSSPHSAIRAQPSKLSTRGWVFQERILSPRIVHFYKEEVVWTCYGLERCECRIMGNVSVSGTFSRLLSGPSKTNLLIEWPKLVAQFTSKDITYVKDRLVAVSGLANLVQQHTHSIYLAGLWSNDLAYSLLWMSDHRHAKKPIRRLPFESYAPTWSWASVDGPVVYLDRHLDQLNYRRTGRDEVDPLLHIVQAQSIPLTHDPFGPAKHSFVTVRGQLLPIRWDPVQNSWKPSIKDGPSHQASAPPSIGSLVGSQKKDSSSQQGAHSVHLEPEFIFDESTGSGQAKMASLENTQFALLRAAIYIWGGAVSTDRSEVVALFVGCVGRVGKPVYRRGGIVLHAFPSDTWKDAPTTEIIMC